MIQEVLKQWNIGHTLMWVFGDRVSFVALYYVHYIPCSTHQTLVIWNIRWTCWWLCLQRWKQKGSKCWWIKKYNIALLKLFFISLSSKWFLVGFYVSHFTTIQGFSRIMTGFCFRVISVNSTQAMCLKSWMSNKKKVV